MAAPQCKVRIKAIHCATGRWANRSPCSTNIQASKPERTRKQNWLDNAEFAALKFRASDQYAALLGGKSQAVAKLAEPRFVLGKLPATATESAQATRDALIADAEHKNRIDSVAAAATELDEQGKTPSSRSCSWHDSAGTHRGA